MNHILSKKMYICYSFIITSICFINIMIYWTMRNSWYFINEDIENSLGKKLPIDLLIFIVLITSFIIIAISTRPLYSNNHSNKSMSIIKHIVIPTIFVIFSTSLVSYLYKELNITGETVTTGFENMIPYVSAVALLVFLLFIYPSLPLSQNRMFKYTIVIVIVLIEIYFSQNIGNVKITSGPFIQYTEDNKMAIIWTTNKNSTGYVEYGNSKDNLKKAYDTSNGIVNANSKIHQVLIPSSNSGELIYKVGSKKVNTYFEYEVKYGNTTESDFKKVKSSPNEEDITFYILSDTHDDENLYREFLSKKDYDFVLFNGDSLDGSSSNEYIINNFLKPISKYTNGEKPIYFVRGNHEARGKSQGELIQYFSLPFNKYYYTFNFGPIYSIVLDSGEDAVDDDQKYSGLSNFKEYRETQRKWLEGLPETEDYKKSLYKIAFLHIPVNDYTYTNDTSYLKDSQIALAKTLSNMKIQGAFSGHTHVPELVEPNDVSNYPIFIGGGEKIDEKNYMGIKVTASKKEMKIQYVSYTGNVTKEHTIKNDNHN